jgi:ElaB/YqjD/DUF883 family membrane-anchored ribosome-binding protein
MNAETLVQAGEQVRAGFSEFSGKVKDVSGDIAERWKDTREDFERRARQIKTATQDRIDEARHHIKARPITYVAAFASGAFALGLLTGWIIGKKRD